MSSPYQKLAEECVKYGVAVELFLFPSSYADVATLGGFASSTGGELHYYKNYVVSCHAYASTYSFNFWNPCPGTDVKMYFLIKGDILIKGHLPIKGNIPIKQLRELFQLRRHFQLGN